MELEDPEEESLLTFDGPGEYMDPKEPIGPKETTLMVWTFDAPFYLSELSKIHLIGLHLCPNLLNHFGSISAISQTTSLVFHQ